MNALAFFKSIACILVLPFLIPLSACGPSHECKSNSECPSDRFCHNGLCALDPGGMRDTVDGPGDPSGDGQGSGSCSIVPGPGDLIINEFLPDPGTLDVNGDGIPSASDDEFIELINPSSDKLSIGGMVYQDAGNKSFTFPSGLCLNPQQALILFGRYEGTGNFGDALVISGNNISLNNGGDSMTFLSPNGQVIAQHSYGSEAKKGQSLVREVDLLMSVGFVPHKEAPFSSGEAHSAGFCQNMASFPNCPSGAPEEDGKGEEDGSLGDSSGGDNGDTGGNGTQPEGCEGEVPGPYDVLINELMPNPGNIDWNADGNADNTEDEYLELIVTANDPVNLKGLSVFDKVQERYTFGELCLAPNEGVVVFGKGLWVLRQDGIAQVDMEEKHTLSINNSDETMELRLKDTNALIDSVSFSKSKAGVALTRLPDLSSQWEEHPELPDSQQKGSPGLCVDASPIPDCLD